MPGLFEAGGMRFESVIASYGLAAIAAGAALEGEAVVATGGLLAHRGLLPLPGVVAAALLGSFLMDQVYFLIGRRARESRFVARVRQRKAFGRALAAMDRHPTGFIFAFRFLWGLRTVSPLAIGTTGVTWQRFAVLNFAAAALWATIVSLVGFGFATGLHVMGLRPKTLEHLALSGAVVAVVAVLGSLLLRRVWRRQEA